MGLEEFLQMLARFAEAIRALAVAVMAYAVGWWLLFSAGIRLVKWTDPRRQYGVPSIIGRSVGGTAFINSAQYLNMTVLTFTGYASSGSGAMNVMPSAGGGVVGLVFSTALAWLAALGAIAIFHGSNMLIKSADGAGQSQQDPVWTGCIFIVSGAIGVNLWRFVGDLI